MAESLRLAMKAMKMAAKSGSTAILFDDVPEEMLHSSNVNVSRWSLIVSDKTLRKLAPQKSSKFFFLDPATARAEEMYRLFWTQQTNTTGIINLNVSGAKEITDIGFAHVCRHNNNIEVIDMSSCSKITDAGFREIGVNCTKLQRLKMNDCQSAEGKGLISIAEHCRMLSFLDISNCRALQRWSVSKMFYNCTRLEEVNISHMKDIGDDEVKILAANCPNLMYFNAKETPCVSDISIQAIAQNCPDIDFIDVSRTSLVFRITDVSLLALGEKSKSLRVLNICGCDLVTDVGINWLSMGCMAIENLNVNGCVRLSDATLRSLGSNCHALNSFDISGARLISDIGITSLTIGCPKLKHLNISGVFLLSDPRLSAPKKGEKVEAWQSVIGIAAIANYCELLEHLDLSGCFRLNVGLEKYVSSLVNLKNLNLTGCNQAKPEALVAVAKNCIYLEELNLSDCGKSVNNEVVSEFVKNSKNMRVLTLSRCEDVKGGALKSIAQHCSNLEKLDLTACKSLTDMMVLPITEVDCVPKLKTLILIGNIHITDSCLAWISSKAHDIVLLALKGTSCSKKSLMAVRDRFPSSEVLANDNFHGYWPKNRYEDRKFVNKYYHTLNGITKLQAFARRKIATKVVANLETVRRSKRSILLMQSFFRMIKAKMRVKVMRERLLIFHRAAIKLQSIFWMVIAQARVRNRKAYLRRKLKVKKAILIQVVWRIHRDYNKLKVLKAAKAAYLRHRIFCATKMESVVRLYLAKVRISKIKQMKYARMALEQRKSKEIQRVFRGMKGRRVAEKAKIAYIRKYKLSIISAKKIQQKFRVFRTNKIVKFGNEMRRNRLKSCINIQKVMRGALARLYVTELWLDAKEKIMLAAVVLIQQMVRKRLARLELKRRLKDQADRERRRMAGIVVIQCFFRVIVSKAKLKELQRGKRDRLRQRAQLELDGIILIQKVYRGYKGRIRYDGLVKERKGKWKELFDEAAQKRYFYNKMTGEIRWRMPQDLLDLIPKPLCDNCTTCDALVECNICNEVYCEECFTVVHRGGRRRDHTYRALYDYHGRRMDYGDGNFPSIWPSEVQQDEVQGWMLRVAPVREPSSVTGNWEQYNEIKEDGRKSKKTFYFNRKTFETTYEKPKEITDAENKYYNSTGNFTYQDFNGYQDASGNWISYDESNQYYQSNQYDYSSEGYYDEQGNWIENYPGYNVEILASKGGGNNAKGGGGGGSNIYNTNGGGIGSSRFPPISGRPSARAPPTHNHNHNHNHNYVHGMASSRSNKAMTTIGEGGSGSVPSLPKLGQSTSMGTMMTTQPPGPQDDFMGTNGGGGNTSSRANKKPSLSKRGLPYK